MQTPSKPNDELILVDQRGRVIVDSHGRPIVSPVKKESK
jgi:hypothetical protein